MLSATLKHGLDYGIGPKIRAVRLKQKMGLVELGRHTGLSPAMLSKRDAGPAARRPGAPHAYRRVGGAACTAVIVTPA